MTRFTVENHAILFALLAKEATQRFGEKGEASILRGVITYGIQRGSRMARRAAVDRRKPDLLSYLLYSELRFDETGNVFKIKKRTPYLEIHASRCAWHTIWQDKGLLEWGKLYCNEIDRSIMRGFNPDFSFEVDGTLSGGNPVCTFHYYDGKLGLLDLLKYLVLKKPLSKRVTQPWDYHTAHLYKAISNSLLDDFGFHGQEIIDMAIKTFKDQYGDECVQKIHELVYKTEFEMI